MVVCAHVRMIRYDTVERPGADEGEAQYASVDDALTFMPTGGLALTLYNDGSNTAA